MNELRASLCSGPQLGLCYMYPAPGVIERIAPDWDWVWVDGQHGELGYADVLAAVRACNLSLRPAIVRVPGHDAGAIGKALDTLADGLMVPMVDTADQARAIVQAAKFPPLGSRSFGGRRPIDRLGRSYAHADIEQPLLICQIETPMGLQNVDEIAAVEGVDALFFGPDDMRLRAGLPMDQPLPVGYFDEALHTVIQAAQKHRKFAGGVFGAPQSLVQAVELGYRLIVATGDVMLLSQGSTNKATEMREALGNKKGAAGIDSPY